jgi:hypothetical protein
MEGGDPFGAIFGPNEHTVARPDAALGKQSGKTAGQDRDFAVGGDAAAVAPVVHHGNLPAEAAEIVEKGGQVGSHVQTLARISILDADTRHLIQIRTQSPQGFSGIVTLSRSTDPRALKKQLHSIGGPRVDPGCKEISSSLSCDLQWSGGGEAEMPVTTLY